MQKVHHSRIYWTTPYDPAAQATPSFLKMHLCHNYAWNEVSLLKPSSSSLR